MTPRVFAVVFTLLYFIAAFLVAGAGSVLSCLAIAIGTAAAWYMASAAAQRAIDLGLVRARHGS